MSKSKRISLAEAAKFVSPIDGRPATANTLRGWIRKGIRKETGLVRLEFLRVGGRITTTEKDVADFLEKTK